MTQPGTLCVFLTLSTFAVLIFLLSDSAYGLQPKNLFFCALKEKLTSYQNNVCERSFTVQQSDNRCVRRRLMIKKIDHQLRFLEQAVLYSSIRQHMTRLEKCQHEFGQQNAQSHQPKENIAGLSARLHELQIRKDEQDKTIYERIEMKNTLQENNMQARQTNYEIQINAARLKKIITGLGSKLRKASSNSSSTRNQDDVMLDWQSCQKDLTHLIHEQSNCSSQLSGLWRKIQSQKETFQNNQEVQRNSSACYEQESECLTQKLACDKIREFEKSTQESVEEYYSILNESQVCLASEKKENAIITNCVTELDADRKDYHEALVNATVREAHQSKVMEQAIACETWMTLCRENATSCHHYTAIVHEKASACWKDLDKWKFRTQMCTSRISMLWNNINSTSEYIEEMKNKIRQDTAKLNACNDRLLYYKSRKVVVTRSVAVYGSFLTVNKRIVANCHQDCPHLSTPSPLSRCPSANYGLPWLDLPSGCYLVTRPGGTFDRMQTYCREQATGSALLGIGNMTEVKDAYTALMRRYLQTTLAEPLGQQRRVWITFVDDFSFSASPRLGYMCSKTECLCWTMKVGWQGRSQLYPCEQNNIAAICYAPHVEVPSAQ